MWFDAHVHARGLRARDLEDLAFFAIAGALVVPEHAATSPSAPEIRREWERAVSSVRRLRRGGLAAWAAVGLGPRSVPPRGLEALLAELPELLGRPEVAALGEVGLDAGGALEERVLARQIDLAGELRVPASVRVPSRERERMTRRAIALLREAEVEPARVLVAPADARTVRMIRACGFHAGLWLSNLGEGTDRGIAEAVRLVRTLGPERIVLGSGAGLGGDLLAVARAADRLEKAGLSEAVARRVCGENAVAWLGVDLAARRPRPRAG